MLQGVTKARRAVTLRPAVLLAAVCLAAPGQDTAGRDAPGRGKRGEEAAEILQQAAKTYRDSHSFEASGVLSARVTISGTSYELKWPLSVAQADSTFLPADSPVPALSPLIRFGLREWRVPGGETVPAPTDEPASPKGWSLFGQIDLGVEDARKLPDETIEFGGRPAACWVIEVVYQPGFPARALANRPVRYWIDQSSYLVLRESFWQRDTVHRYAVQRNGTNSEAGQREALEWVFSATDVKVNEPPPSWALRALPQLAGQERGEWIGRLAPEFLLADLDGREVSLRALRGKAVLLSFWASWCAPCKQEMPMIERLAAEFEPAGLLVWGISNESGDKAREWLTRNGRRLPTLLDEGRKVFRDYEAQKIPASVVVDRSGNVVSYRVGLSGEGDLRAAIGRALEPASAGR
jgi:peroxiredoxin